MTPQVFGRSHWVHVVPFTEIDEVYEKLPAKRMPGCLLLGLVSQFLSYALGNSC